MPKYFVTFILLLHYVYNLLAVTEKITYISVEHPVVTFINHTYIDYAYVTARRRGRTNPVYYMDMRFYAKQKFGDDVQASFYFYEFLTNVYKRSFVEMHFGICKLLNENQFFGHALRQGKLKGSCPFPAGEYELQNMTVLPEAIPPAFPFTKGRIYANLSFYGTKIQIGTGYVDMEIKNFKSNRTRNTKL